MRIIDKIFGDKKVNAVIYIVLAAGILMLVGSNSFVHSNSAKTYPVEEQSTCTLKEETQNILSEIKGVGEVSVMISFAENTKELQRDIGVMSSTQEKTADIESVLVVAEGGENPSIREKIVRATKAALGVDPHKIEVFERKERQ